MKTSHLFLALVVGLVATATPLNASAATPTGEWEYIRKVTGSGSHILKDASYDEDAAVSIYRMRKGVLTDHLRTRDVLAPSDQVIWNIFKSIADKETIDKRIFVFTTYEETTTPVLAYVQKLDRKKTQSWVLGVNANAARPEGQKWTREMAAVLVHEYAHIVTLNEKQMVTKKGNVSSCKKTKTMWLQFFGCTLPDSYLNTFANKFWSEEDIKLAEKAEQRDATADFYATRPNDFVTVYAASNPVEDIAESFTEFILRKKPTGTAEKDQKILFFYEYPELVTMRATIRANTAQYFVK